MHKSNRKRLEAANAQFLRIKEDNKQELNKIAKDCIAIEKEYNLESRKALSKEDRQRLYDEQEGICPLCGAKLELQGAEADHIIAFSNGGGNEYENFQLTHRICNRRKSDKNDSVDVIHYHEQKLAQLSAKQTNRR